MVSFKDVVTHYPANIVMSYLPKDDARTYFKLRKKFQRGVLVGPIKRRKFMKLCKQLKEATDNSISQIPIPTYEDNQNIGFQ